MVSGSKKNERSKNCGFNYSYENTSANMSFPGKNYHLYTGWYKQCTKNELKSHMNAFIMLNWMTALLVSPFFLHLRKNHQCVIS